MMNLNKIIVAASVAAVSTFASFAHADFDIRPYVAGGQIITGGHDDGTGEDIDASRAFAYAFGEDPADPYFTQDPGFNAEANSGLPGGSQLMFNILGPLTYWTGSGLPSFGGVPSNESLTFSFGAQSRNITGTSAAQSGFNLQTVNADGSSHRHLNAFLNGADGNAVAGDGVVAADGVYAVLLELASSSPAIKSSDPFYVVYGNGVDDAAVDAAASSLSATLVPEPTTLAALAGAGILALARRRRPMANA